MVKLKAGMIILTFQLFANEALTTYYMVMGKASCRLPLHSRINTVSRPTTGNMPEKVKQMVWSLENFGLPVNITSSFHENFP